MAPESTAQTHSSSDVIADINEDVVLDLIQVSPNPIEPPVTREHLRQAAQCVRERPGLTISFVNNRNDKKRTLSDAFETEENEPKSKKPRNYPLWKNWPEIYTKGNDFSYNFSIMNAVARVGLECAETLRGLDSYLVAKKGRPTHQQHNSMSRAVGILHALGPLLERPALSINDKEFYSIIARKRVYEIYEEKVTKANVYLLTYKLLCIQARISV